MSHLDDAGQPHGAELTLASLAYINVSWEANRTSYLDNFIPFALEALRAARGAQSVAQIRGFIADRFGLDFPSGVVSSLLDRAVRVKQVKRVRGAEALELMPGVAEKLPDLVAQQGETRRRQNHLVNALVSFASKRFQVEWGDDAAEEALLSFVQSNAVPLLGAAIRGEKWESSTSDEDRSYVVSSFVATIVESDPISFDYLDELIKGSTLSAVLYVDPTGQVSRKFKQTTLFLNTPVCIRALGYDGAEAQEAARSILAIATAQGAELGCFRHTVREIRGVLEAAKHAMSRGPRASSGPGGVIRHFRKSGATKSDVELALANLERDLARLGIQTRETPEHTPSLGVDEGQLEAVLQEGVRYRESETLLADLDSLTAIHRWRRGASDVHLETSRAVLITNNKGLVRASSRFFKGGRHGWPLAMTDASLAALLWVKAPTAAPDLPRRQVIADCYSAMAPTSSFWIKFIEEVDRLETRGEVDPEGVALLRYSHEAEQAIMDTTLGDPSRVSEMAIAKSLQKALNAAAAPALEERDQAVRRAEAAELAEAATAFEAARHEAEASYLSKRVESLEQKEAERSQRLYDDTKQVIRRRVAWIRGLGVLILLASVLTGVGSFFPPVVAWLASIFRPAGVGSLWRAGTVVRV